MQNNIVVKARGVKKKYSDNNALNGFDLDLHQGQILGLIGPNGAGKTTFFYMIVGLLGADSGKISIDSEIMALKISSDRSCSGLIRGNVSNAMRFIELIIFLSFSGQ